MIKKWLISFPLLYVRTGTYAVAVGYCVTDVAYEAYKLQKRGGVTEYGAPMSITQVRYGTLQNYIDEGRKGVN